MDEVLYLLLAATGEVYLLGGEVSGSGEENQKRPPDLGGLKQLLVRLEPQR